MPLIQVKVVEGVFSKAQKEQIIQKLTEAMVSIEGENMLRYTWVLIEEVKDGHWGMGGKPVTATDVKSKAKG